MVKQKKLLMAMDGEKQGLMVKHKEVLMVTDWEK
jgi:hypothetical protein